MNESMKASQALLPNEVLANMKKEKSIWKNGIYLWWGKENPRVDADIQKPCICLSLSLSLRATEPHVDKQYCVPSTSVIFTLKWFFFVILVIFFPFSYFENGDTFNQNSTMSCSIVQVRGMHLYAHINSRANLISDELEYNSYIYVSWRDAYRRFYFLYIVVTQQANIYKAKSHAYSPIYQGVIIMYIGYISFANTSLKSLREKFGRIHL